jgi:aldose sugar dehydrogenase
LPAPTPLAALISISNLLISCNTAAFAQNEVEDMPRSTDRSLTFELVSAGLTGPTSMAFLGPDDILVTEKNTGTVQRVLNGEILEEPLLDVSVTGQDERGLLGIAISKNVSDDRTYVFLYYTEAESVHREEDTNGDGVEEGRIDGGEPIGNRLYRYELSKDSTKLVNPKLLLDLPYDPGPAHTGGAIAIGPDNHVYLTVGDMTPPSYDKDDFKFKVQNYHDGDDPDGRAGIIRVTQDGAVVGDKGILGDDHPLDMYYAYGIRNSFGIAFDPLTGNLWDTENGPSFGDELNLVEPGFNSGWAKILGIWKVEEITDEKGKRKVIKGEVAANTNESLVDFEGNGKYSSPELTWDEIVAPTAIAFQNSGNLGDQYIGEMFIGTVIGRLLHFGLDENRSELILDGSIADKLVDTEDELEDYTLAQNLGIISDVEIGPDGYLYILNGVREYEGKICRIVPSQGRLE